MNVPNAMASGVSDEQLKSKLIKDYQKDEVIRSGYPHEIVTLPSRGVYYPVDSPLSTGQVALKYMTAREEDILSSENLLRKNKAIDMLLEALILTKGVNADDLIVSDRDALLVFARVLAYGPIYKFTMNDPFNPDEEQEVSVDLTQLKEKDIDLSDVEQGQTEFDLTLPHGKRSITVKILTYGESQKISNILKQDKKNKKADFVDREYTTRLKSIITSVDGDDSREAIDNFVDNELMSLDAREIRKFIANKVPALDLTFTFVSRLTDQEKEGVPIPMGVEFFWPKS